MAGSAIGTAWIQIKPSTTGLRNAVQKELNTELTPVAENSGEEAGKSWGDKFVTSMKKVVGLAAIGSFLKDAISVGADFQSSMSQVAATLGYGIDELNDKSSVAFQTMTNLTDFAEEMGKTTVFTARQSADALNYMALAGYDAETSMKMLPTVLNLAAAGNFDLALASDMVTDAQTALGLSLEETSVLVDQMARTSSRSNTSVSQLGEAMLQIGGTARILSGGTAELSTALGLLADNGIKSSEGGTQLRNILRSLANPTKSGKELLDNLGVSVFDAAGNMRSLQDIFTEFSSAIAGFTQEQRTAALSEIFNVRDLKGAEALLGTNIDRWRELGTEIANSKGAAENMAAVQLDNLKGDAQLLNSAFESFQITLEETLAPLLRPFIQALTSIFQFIAENEWALDILLGLITAIAGALLISLIPTIWSLTAALLANPITWIIIGIGLVIAGIIELVKHIDEVKRWFGDLFESVGNWFRGVMDTIQHRIAVIKAFIHGFIEGVKIGFQAMGESIKRVFNTIVGVIKAPINAIIRGINSVLDKINAIKIPDWVPLIGGAHTNFGHIPELAGGGLVSGVGTSTSDSNLAALSRGEYVIRAAAAREIGYDNLERMNQTGEVGGTEIKNYFTINGYNKSPEELAEIISRKIAFRTQGVLA